MELIGIWQLLIDSHLIIWLPALIAGGWLLKHCTRLPNDMIDALLFATAILGSLVYGYRHSTATGAWRVADIVLRYGIGQGFFLSAASTHLYGIVHGFLKIKPTGKEGRSVKKTSFVRNLLVLVSSLIIGAVFNLPFGWGAVLDFVSQMMVFTVITIMVGDVVYKLMFDRDAVIWQYWVGVSFILGADFCFLGASKSVTFKAMWLWLACMFVVAIAAGLWWAIVYKTAMTPLPVKDEEMKDTEDNYPYDAATTGEIAEEEN